MKIRKSSWSLEEVHFLRFLIIIFLVLILSWFFCLSRPIPRLLLKLIFKRDQDQDMSWKKISNETDTKTGLDLKILSRPRPILGLDSPCLEFRDQYQESCWTLRCWLFNLKIPQSKQQPIRGTELNFELWTNSLVPPPQGIGLSVAVGQTCK